MIGTKYREGGSWVEVFETQERVYGNGAGHWRRAFDRIIAKGSSLSGCHKGATNGTGWCLAIFMPLALHTETSSLRISLLPPGTDSKIIITDFGLASARKKGDDCLMKTTCGTPEHIAPEVLVRKPYTNSVDMWALGVIAYILLSGTMPFEDDNRTADTGRPSGPWPSVSNLAKDFIDRLLTVDPGARMTALQALRHPWVVSMAASSSMKNLHRSISQNLLKRASSRCQSTKSSQSTRSSRSTRSNKSRRVRERELRELNLRYQQQYNG
ncbi:Serine/threonine-protein kinase H1 [Apodemus speciosus]|uniref:non-specific serine/threonine protein kinase n=1 Tax=Apodemus speciosus TaxID=105296 RepID=A0ABQ0F2S9_APOSI